MIKFGDVVVDAALVGNSLAIRNYRGRLENLTVDGVHYRVVKTTPSVYVPGILIATIEKL